MLTRLLAAAVGLAGLLPAIIFGGQLAVEIIVPLVMAICLHEYAGMAFPDDKPAGLGWLALGTAGLYSAAMYTSHLDVAVFVVAIATFVFVTLRPGADLGAASSFVGRYLVGMVWITGLGSLVLLRRFDHGLALIFLVLAVSWLGDTGGYFAGKYFGKKKLYERVSPKKTWMGAFGGVAAATAGAFIVRGFGLPLAPWECVVLGVGLCSAGILGDLFESLLKRSYGVKDSGTIMPGHGGMLDRIDSVLFVAPLLYFWMTVRPQ